jgi:acyl-coenzyme A thioesterase PaaI-like protein
MLCPMPALTPDATSPPQPSQTRRTVVPFHEHAQIEIIDASAAVEGQGRAAIPDAPFLKNHFGTVHGGMLFAVGEVAAASAMMRVLGSESLREVLAQVLSDDARCLRAITRRGAIDYLKPARGAVSGAATVGMSAADIAASLTRSPSIDVPVSVVLTDSSGATVARLDITWFVGRPKE